MKILMVSKHVAGALPGDFYYPGEWVDAFQFSMGLRSAGAEVSLLTPKVQPHHRGRFEAEFGDLLRRRGIRHHFAPTPLQTGSYGGSFRLRLFIGEMRVLRSERPDVVVYLGLGPSLLVGRRRRPPLVPFICWGESYHAGRAEDDRAKKEWSGPLPLTARWEDRLFRFLVARWGAPTSEELLRRSEAIAVLHPRGYELLRVKPELSGKTFLTVKGVDFRAADAATPQGKPVDVLFVGGIPYGKGIFDLIEAFARVNAEMPQASLGIAGSGPPELVDEMRRTIARLRINAHYFGSVPFNSRWGYYKKARIFGFPSLQDNYNSSLLEAMACRLPVVTTEAVDSPVEDGVTGFLVLPGDVEKLAERLIWLLKNDEERTRMGNLARGKVRDWRDVAAESIREIFTPLVREKHGSRI